MKKFFRNNGYAMYLGGAIVAFADLDMGNWQAWAILIPTIILVFLRRVENETDNM